MTAENAFNFIKGRVEQGMRSRLTSGSLLTGALFVDLAFSESEPGTFAAGLPYSQLPAAPSATRNMVAQMEAEGFGHCTNHYECMDACPKSIDVEFIATLNRDFMTASVAARTPLKDRSSK